MKKQKFFIIYQITNLINNHIYVGAHSTYELIDRYMGSSQQLKTDIKKLGRQNFKKEILHIFDNKEDMMKMESEIVNRKFCHRPDTYNLMVGGINNYITTDMVTVKDKDGNTSKVYIDDPRYLSGELVPNMKGLFHAKDKNGNTFTIDKNDSRYLSGELKSIQAGMAMARDKNNNKTVVSINDPRWITGEITGITKGIPQHPNAGFKNRKHSEKFKQKIGLINSEKQKGELNSQFGTCWVTNGTENKKIKKELLEKYLEEGYYKGRITKINCVCCQAVTAEVS